MIKSLRLAGALIGGLAFFPAALHAACDITSTDYTLDWNGSYAAWTAGSLSKVITVPNASNNTSTDVSVSFAGATNRRYTSAMPQTSGFFYDNTGVSQYSLAWAMDLDNNSEMVNITFSFDTPVDELSFKIIDVDTTSASGGTGGFRDSIEITSINSQTGSTPRPVLSTPYHSGGSNRRSTIYIGNPLSSNQAIGYDGNAQNGSNQGNLNVFFTEPVTSVTIEYSNKLYGPSSTPQAQGISVGDLDFCTASEPEPEPEAEIQATKTQQLISESPVNCDVIPSAPDEEAAFAGPGACIEYTISVQNTGDAAAADLSVVDDLSDDMIFQAATFSGFQNDGPLFGLSTPSQGQDCSGGACTVSVDDALLDVGETGSITIRAIVK